MNPSRLFKTTLEKLPNEGVGAVQVLLLIAFGADMAIPDIVPFIDEGLLLWMNLLTHQERRRRRRIRDNFR